MGRILAPVAMTAAMIAFTVAALSAGLVMYHPSLWPAAVHLAMILLSGPLGEMRSMITGWFPIRPEKEAP